ncbi:hypothetical protein ACWF9G_15565 [Nocardia sp. NPDC055029]
MLDWIHTLPRATRVIRQSLLRPDLIRAIRPVTLFPILPYVDGIEVTQSIQFFRASQHLTDPSDRGPDNSLRLVASKPAWVRVYADPGLLGLRLSGVLEVETLGNDGLFHHTATLSPRWPASVDASVRDFVARRSTVTNTLNFVVPADKFRGRMRLTFTLTDLAGNTYDTKTLLVHATLRQTLRLRGILVSYNGADSSSAPTTTLNLAPPTMADLRTTAALATRALPVRSEADLGFAGRIPWNLPLDDPPPSVGGCSLNWNALMTQLVDARNNDGNRPNVVYYGLLPTGTPVGPVVGCRQSAVGAGAAGNQRTLLHEVGHVCGFQHTAGCGMTGTTDPNFPQFEPYFIGSIGEFGLDVADGTILPPDTTGDFMGRCTTRWMSTFRHKALIGHQFLAPEDVDIDIPVEWDPRLKRYSDAELVSGSGGERYFRAEMQFHPVIAVSGIVDDAGHVDVRSVVRVPAAGRPPGERTTMIARLIGSEGQTLARGKLLRSISQSCCCDAANSDDFSSGYFFEAYLPDAARGAELVIDDTAGGGAVLWRRTAPQQRPSIERFEAKATGDNLEIHWQAGPTNEELEAWVQYSTDDGVNWEGLATGIRGANPVVDIASVPSGRVLVRIMVHNGFDTVASDAVAVQVPLRTPEVVILWPEQDGVLVAGGPLRVLGSVADTSGRPLPDASYHWVLDEKDLGDGDDEWFDAPGPGTHRLTLFARAPGFESERLVTFTCLPVPGNEPPIGGN